MKHLLKTLLILTAATAPLTLSACTAGTRDTPNRESLVQAESDRLNTWFKNQYEDDLAISPMSRTYLGRPGDQDRLDDISQTAIDERAAIAKARLDTLRRDFDVDRLDPQTRLSYELFEFGARDEIATHAVSRNDYVFQHMSGPHSDLPSFLINFQQVNSAEDARNYIARLNAFQAYLGQAAERANVQYENGVVLPKFVYGKISDAARNVITGAPFDESETASPLWKDVTGKIDALNIDPAEKNVLKADAREALMSSVQPAYLRLLEMFAAHAQTATPDDGVWKLPNGEAYYNARIKHYTTTDLTANEIHEIGLREVDRIQAEMRDIIEEVGFDGTLKEFYTFLRTDPQFTFPNTDAGREAYIAEATTIIDVMKAQMDDLFITQPVADMVVKRVEPFREDTAFGAFYDQPALDGSRPGTYYINLRDMADQPKFLIQALAYHEGIPGHHMQIAIAQELQGLPEFRTLGGHTAYIEGWALYAEALPAEVGRAEHGLYKNPYKRFGQLGMEIFRAARLVVDTGIHSKKWDREKAVQYYLDNIPNPEGDVRAEIDRYIVWPGQATAYMIGKLKIEELRAKSETELGDKFDIREFHDIVLANGSVPLAVLERLVDQYIQTTKEARS